MHFVCLLKQGSVELVSDIFILYTYVPMGLHKPILSGTGVLLFCCYEDEKYSLIKLMVCIVKSDVFQVNFYEIWA